MSEPSRPTSHSSSKSGSRRSHVHKTDLIDRGSPYIYRRESLPANPNPKLSATKKRRSISQYEDSESASHSQELNTQPLLSDEKADTLPDPVEGSQANEYTKTLSSRKSQSRISSSIAEAHAGRFSTSSMPRSGRSDTSRSGSSIRGNSSHLADRHSFSTSSSSPLSKSAESSQKNVTNAPVAALVNFGDYKRRQLEAAKRSIGMKKRRIVL